MEYLLVAFYAVMFGWLIWSDIKDGPFDLCPKCGALICEHPALRAQPAEEGK